MSFGFMSAYLAACGCGESARLYDRIQMAISLVLIVGIFAAAGLTFLSTHLSSAIAQTANYYNPHIAAATAIQEHKRSRGHKHNRHAASK